MAVKRVPRGCFYEDFTEGRVFEHHWGRTLTGEDDLLFNNLTMHYNPVYFSVEYARRLGYEGMVVTPLLVMTTVLGLTVRTCRRPAVRSWDRRRAFLRPCMPATRSRALEVLAGASRGPGRGGESASGTRQAPTSAVSRRSSTAAAISRESATSRSPRGG